MKSSVTICQMSPGVSLTRDALPVSYFVLQMVSLEQKTVL